MSKKALSAAQMEQWRGIVHEMRSDGTMLRIFQKYFQSELAASLVNF